jgi:phosphoribosylanthranilate isomerase
MLVQIYEVQTPEEARALTSLGVDHIGVLVGDGAFPRELSIAQTNAIFAAVPSGTKRVALSLSADPEEVARVVRETRPDIIQLQAAIEEFSVEMTRRFRHRFPEIPIMRALPVIDEASIEDRPVLPGRCRLSAARQLRPLHPAVRRPRPRS